MLNGFPNLSEKLVNASNVFSIIKSISTSVFFIILIFVLVLLGIKTLNSNKENF